jgi:peptidoglycan/xylan/chitin deacetylase (PgdA/CDA1 family)
MQDLYNAYFGIVPSSQPSLPVSPSPSPGNEPTHEKVAVYISFTDIAAGQLDLLLDILDTSDYKCAFFVAADEVTENADLLRRAAGAGHTLGLF